MAKVKISGKKMIGKSVKSFDGKDLGEIKSISADYVELKHGNDHYFIPKLHVKEFDKENLYVLLMKDEVKDRYERNNPHCPQRFNMQNGQDKDLLVTMR
ncbi:MAG TPA: hypothetical protein VIA09_03750 [Nitrososphaeraceae archaeon]